MIGYYLSSNNEIYYSTKIQTFSPAKHALSKKVGPVENLKTTYPSVGYHQIVVVWLDYYDDDMACLIAKHLAREGRSEGVELHANESLPPNLRIANN